VSRELYANGRCSAKYAAAQTAVDRRA